MPPDAETIAASTLPWQLYCCKTLVTYAVRIVCTIISSSKTWVITVLICLRKNVVSNFLRWLHQLLTNFENSSTLKNSNKLSIKFLVLYCLSCTSPLSVLSFRHFPWTTTFTLTTHNFSSLSIHRFLTPASFSSSILSRKYLLEWQLIF